MPREVIGAIPEFTSDDSSQNPAVIRDSGVNQEEYKNTVESPTTEQEKVTPAETLPTNEPVSSAGGQQRNEDVDMEQQVQALQEQRLELLKEIANLRGQKREIKTDQQPLITQIADELKDVYPDDANLVDKVVRAKGYITREEASQMFYEAVKTEELSRFLEKYPEYKPENDSNDLNWNALQREFTLYRKPDNPRDIGKLLERARMAVHPTSPINSRRTQNVAAQQRRIDVASAGSGGAQQRLSSTKSLDPRYRQELVQGGWSEEDIQKIEARITD